MDQELIMRLQTQGVSEVEIERIEETLRVFNNHLTTRQVALLHGVQVRTVSKWCLYGRIPATRFGDRWLIPLEAALRHVPGRRLLTPDEREQVRRLHRDYPKELSLGEIAITYATSLVEVQRAIR